MTSTSNIQVNNSKEVLDPEAWVTGTEMLNQKDDDSSHYLWEPFMRKVGMVALAGPSDCGKSILVRQLAIAVATKQKTFLGSPLNVNHGRVCYIATEDEQYGTKTVLKKQLKGFGVEKLDNLHFKFESTNFYKATKAFLSKNKADLIIVDAWLDIFLGNPNDPAAVRRELNPWHSLALQHECCILLLHHLVKNSENTEPNKNRLNGSQGLEAKLRLILDLRAVNNGVPNERQLTIIKGNYLPPEMKNKPWILTLNPDTMLFTKTGARAQFEGVAKKKGYNREKWLERYSDASKNGGSIKSVVGILEDQFPDEEIPSVTWFKENRLASDGRCHSKEDDRPTIPDSLNSLLYPDIEEGTLPGQR